MARDHLQMQEQDHEMMDLTRLLRRLERNLLLEEPGSRRPMSTYERTKVGANLQYAHSLILRLEHASPTAKSREQKNRTQSELQPKRVLLKKLQNRLHELNQLDDADLDGPQADGSEPEDLLSKYAPQTTSRSTNANSLHQDSDSQNQPPTNTRESSEHSRDPPNSTLRARRGNAPAAEDVASTTGSSIAADRARLLSSNRSQTSAGSASNMPENDKLLAHHTSEQENITSSLLNLATALKQSTLSFSDELTSSNPLIDRATSSLDQNVTGMEAAERRMTMLRRMTEGRGWLGRISLYGWIAALWVALILIMFVMPKLRF